MKQNSQNPNDEEIPKQLSLGGDFTTPQDDEYIKEPNSVIEWKLNESVMRSRVSISALNTPRLQLPTLNLPYRYERLEAEAQVKNVPLRPLIKPVREALADIEREIGLVRESGMGRLYVITGVTGSGKTTLLKSLKLFVDAIDIHDVRQMSLESRVSIENTLILLKRSTERVSVVILEGRENPGSLTSAEIDLLLTTLNNDFRSDIGKKTLFVISTTSATVAQEISQRAAETGGMTSRTRPFYVFNGPSRNQYVPIINELLRAFNEGRTLTDYGVAEEVAQGVAEATSSVGQFIESCHQEIMSLRARLEEETSKVKHKRIHLWMIFCSSEKNETLRRNYDIIRALTVGDHQNAQVARLLSGDSKEVRKWQNKAAAFALAASYLDLRIMYLPLRTAVALFTAYAPTELIQFLKDQDVIQRETVRARAQESLANTAIGAYLQSRSFTDDPTRRGKLDERQLEIFKHMMEIAQSSEIILNTMVAQTLRDWLIASPETAVTTQQPVNEAKTLLSDIAVIDSTDIYCLEMKWRSAELHDSEVIRETVSRVTDFVDNLPELYHLMKK